MQYVFNPFTRKPDAFGTGTVPGYMIGLDGDTGGFVPPNGGGIIHILGSSNGVAVTGIPGSYTLSIKNLRNLSNYVVDPIAGETEYTVIQYAIDDAFTAGGGTVYIRPGTYTEDLILKDGVNIVGPGGGNCIIDGHHTFSGSGGSVSFKDIVLSNTGTLFSSSNVGPYNISLQNCQIRVDSGYIFSYPFALSGNLFISDCIANTGTDCAILNTTGNMFLTIDSSWVGTDLTSAIITSGGIFIDSCEIVGPIVLNGSAASRITESVLNSGITVNDSASISIYGSEVVSAAAPCVTQNSSTGITIQDSSLTAYTTDVISGTGKVNLNLVLFPQSSNITGTVNVSTPAHLETGKVHIGKGVIDSSQYLEIVENLSNATINSSIHNSSTTGTTSNARLLMKVGGATAGDEFVSFQNIGGGIFSFGHRATVNSVSLTNAATLAPSSILWDVDSNGAMTIPKQPAFLAAADTSLFDVTGSGTVVAPVKFVKEKFDLANNYDNSTGIFTASVTGKYRFEAGIRFGAVAGTNSNMTFRLITTTREYYGQEINPGVAATAANFCAVTSSWLADMTVGDTAYISVSVSGSATDNITIRGDALDAVISYFSGNLVC